MNKPLLGIGSAFVQQRFLIERDIPGASKLSAEQLPDAARTSYRVLHGMGPHPANLVLRTPQLQRGQSGRVCLAAG